MKCNSYPHHTCNGVGRTICWRIWKVCWSLELLCQSLCGLLCSLCLHSPALSLPRHSNWWWVKWWLHLAKCTARSEGQSSRYLGNKTQSKLRKVRLRTRCWIELVDRASRQCTCLYTRQLLYTGLCLLRLCLVTSYRLYNTARSTMLCSVQKHPYWSSALWVWDLWLIYCIALFDHHRDTSSCWQMFEQTLAQRKPLLFKLLQLRESRRSQWLTWDHQS